MMTMRRNDQTKNGFLRFTYGVEEPKLNEMGRTMTYRDGDLVKPIIIFRVLGYGETQEAAIKMAARYCNV